MLFDAVLEGFMVVIYDGDCYLMFCYDCALFLYNIIGK